MKELLSSRVRTSVFLGVVTLFASVWLAAGRDYLVYGAEGFGAEHGPMFFGQISLDAGAERSVIPLGGGGSGSVSIYSSPAQIFAGSFGDWTFSGLAEITVTDGPEYWLSGDENLSPDSWVARVNITGPTVNDWTPTRLSLFYSTSPAAINGAGLLPPMDPLTSASPYDFQFAIDFVGAGGEEQSMYGQLFTIQSVPEPTTGALLAFGAAGLLMVARRKGRR